MNFNWDNSYLKLPSFFYELQFPETSPQPEAVLWNEALFQALGITEADVNFLSGNGDYSDNTPYAQAYAGHQFGHFTMLGDGRALHLGEHCTPYGQRFDIQLKGSGKTPYSRGGDGKATLRFMLREYLMSEAIHHLGISTSRSLSVVKTGNQVLRETIQDGAVLTRVMKSHIRVGTFEYARYFGNIESLQQLTSYTASRLYPEVAIGDTEGFILKVMAAQIETVCHWMRVGFVHGVMNTDNTSISGETFDYGPCAFMNTYHPKTVYSSIDRHGRYAFGNQPDILKWNLTRWLESLLPLLHDDEEQAILLANEMLGEFGPLWKMAFGTMMRSKIGLMENHSEADQCWQKLLYIMEKKALDYTDTFSFLTYGFDTERFARIQSSLKDWLTQWRSMSVKYSLMKETNPVIIPRNQWVEELFDTMEKGQHDGFHQGLNALESPYNPNNLEVNRPPIAEFDNRYLTYCGT
jgi:uncharacterized protein YdiU (UPF0061 family)